MIRLRSFGRPFGADRSTQFSHTGMSNRSRNAAMNDSDSEDSGLPGQARMFNYRSNMGSRSPFNQNRGRHVTDDRY